MSQGCFRSFVRRFFRRGIRGGFRGSIALGVLLGAPTLFGATVESPLDARLAVCERLLGGDVEERRVFVAPRRLDSGDVIYGWFDVVLAVPESGYVVFVDDQPFASFPHACRYVFVSGATGDLEVSPATTPSRDIGAWLERDTLARRLLMRAGNVRSTPSPRNSLSQPDGGAGVGDLWAVLINGGYDAANNHVRYWNDLSSIYTALIDVYGYKDENIIVLCSDGLDPTPDQSNGSNSDPDLDGDGDDDIQYPSDLTSFNTVFTQLQTTLAPEDQLFVFTTDHGSTSGGQDAVLILWGGWIFDADFATLVDGLPACTKIFTMEQCYSGGFLDDLALSQGRVFSSACAYDELSWAMPPSYEYDTYVFYWTAAVAWEDAYGTPCNADLDGNGVVSMREAFLYAEANDSSSETPQYHSTPSNLGEELNLLGLGEVLHVPGDYATIQDAIDAVANGGTVLVAPGTYLEYIDFDGKDIRVRSDGDGDPMTYDPVPATTIIDGGGAMSVVSFAGGEGSGAVIEGFTITNGSGGCMGGGGVDCPYSSPSIAGNIIKGNSGTIGAGIMVGVEAQPRIKRNRIEDNTAFGSGGGIHCSSSAAVIVGNEIVGNDGGTFGGGIYCANASPEITNNLFYDNSATNGGGLAADATSMPTVTNCTFWDNLAVQSGGGLYIPAAVAVTNSIIRSNTPEQIAEPTETDVTYCNVEDGWTGTGNFDSDPQFADADGGDFRLSPLSACIDVGDGDALPADNADVDEDRDSDETLPIDLEGRSRVADGRGDSQAVVDIGACEHDGVIGLSSGVLSFESVAVGSYSDSQEITVANVGDQELTIGEVSITGSDADHFEIEQEDCSQTTFSSGESGTITVRFAPQSSGSKEAGVSIPSNDPLFDSITVVLTGTGQGCQIDVTPSSHHFRAVKNGKTSKVCTFTVSNVGANDLVIGEASLTGVYVNSFEIWVDGVSGETIPPGEDRSILVVFTPISRGYHGATLVIPSNDPANPTLDLLLEGEGFEGKSSSSYTCALSTVATGSYLEPHLDRLREFRDERLKRSSAGAWLVRGYYALSPSLTLLVAGNAPLTWAARFLLTPVVLVVVYPRVGVLCVGLLVFLYLKRRYLARLALVRVKRRERKSR